MKLNDLAEKVLPPLMVVAIITMGGAVFELRALSLKVEYLEKAIIAYHEVK